MNSESQKHIGSTSQTEALSPRTVEAVSWFDRARIRNRRLRLPDFQNEVKTPTNGTDLASLAEQASKNIYKPTMDAKGRHMKTIQEDLAEQAAEGGVGIGAGKHSYEAPATNLNNMDGLQYMGLGNIPLLGKLLVFIRSNPRAARAIATPQRIQRGTFSVRVTSAGAAQYNGPYDVTTGRPRFPDQPNSPYWTPAQKTTRDVDLVDVQTPNALTADERSSIDSFTASLLKGVDGSMMSPQQVLKLHDQLQAGQQVSLKAGPNGAAWMNRVMGGVGEMLKDDAARIGSVNLVAHLFTIGSAITSALGLAVAAGAWGYGMAKINPANSQIAPLAAQGSNPYAAPTSTDPAAAFGDNTAPAGAAPVPAPTTAPMPSQPFGAVSQNFGNLGNSQQTGIGAMPMIQSTPPANSPYEWTRVNSTIGRVLWG